jgi:two-component system phosphate regulon sensor histidine kinase PhoR
VPSLAGRPYFLLVLALAAAAAMAGILIPWAAAAVGPRAVVPLVLLLFASVSVFGYLSFRSLNRRFQAIATCAQSLADGDLDARAPVDAHDELARLARAINDLADRFQAKLRELNAERDSSEAILGNLPLGLALLGRNLTIRHANERFWQMMGLERPRASVRLAAARQPSLEEMALDSIRRGHAVAREVTLYLGGRKRYEVGVTPIGGGGGAATQALLLSVEDLGPEKAMAALRREFVANASHELKTPLTSIRGYAETLLAGGLEDEVNRTRFVETIQLQASRLEALVEDLLQLADLERPDAPLDLKDWDLGVIARDLVDTFEDLAARRGLRLTLEGPSGIRARVDRNRLELALRNLLDNAVKYTDTGEITLRVDASPTGIRIAVSDTGRGIAPEHIPRLFERFYRVDRGRSRALGGTGLGLSIVKHAIQLHGGTVGVESRPGQGSTFWLELPPEGAVAGP